MKFKIYMTKTDPFLEPKEYQDGLMRWSVKGVTEDLTMSYGVSVYINPETLDADAAEMFWDEACLALKKKAGGEL